MSPIFTIFISLFITSSCEKVMHGRYTREIINYHLSIPHKLSRDGHFTAFHIPHFYHYNTEMYKERKKRNIRDDNEMIHYGIPIKAVTYHVDLWPNRNFIHPNLVFETRDSSLPIKERDVRGIESKKLCHYVGKIRGIDKSKVALSTCDGLVGYMIIGGKKYIIEPVDDHIPNDEGHHLHVVYEDLPDDGISKCGVKTTRESENNKSKKENTVVDMNKRSEANTAVHANIPKYIETTVVCDKSFINYHKARDIELYVMTLMNGVNNLYHDNTTAQVINVEVVRVIYLEKEEEEIDLQISANAFQTLDSFGKWVTRINQPKDSPTHHDIGVLLSKYDLCHNATTKEGCTTTGLANIGTACTTDGKAGAINEDKGLGHLTVIIAHEIGHLLGLDHDGDVQPCNVTDTDGAYFVMSPNINIFTTKWSPCSRNDLKIFFDAKLGECLNDEPSLSLYPYVDHMPGVIFNENEQCRILYPESGGACRTTALDFCSYFTCMLKNNTVCAGIKGQGPVDGTKCGDNKWCYKQKCVPMGSRPEAINGGWSEWTEWSGCSRTCGGGITYQERICDNPIPANRGKYCTGDRKRVKLCNAQLCPENSIPFREFQCEQQNSKPSALDQRLHKWTAAYNFDYPCKLICFTKDLGLFDFESVKDGTLCKPGTRDVCISGFCRTVGCDMKLDSEAVEDRCGMCNGDGTTCKIVDGTYDEKVKDPSKIPKDNVFAKIPMGSRKIFIKEMEESPNAIAISNGNKKSPTFYLNKDGKSSFRGYFKIPGSKGLYFMRGKRAKQDHVIINGPISVDLAIWVLYYKSSDGTYANPGYYYSWAEADEQNKYEPIYSWEIGEYGDCSAKCGGGIQEPIWSCMEEKGGRVSPTFCIGINKPAQTSKKCNEQPCKARWNVGSWGRCHACKKKGGVRTRPVECLKQNPKLNGDAILVEDSECSGVKPGAVQLCQTDKKCTSRKKRNAHIPGKHQELVWQQMTGIHIEKREIDNSSSVQNVTQCHVTINGTVNPHQNSTVPPSVSVGKFVRDGEPLENQKLVEFELIRQNMNISDNQMRPEETGNPLGTTKIYSGEALATFIHNFEFTRKPTSEATKPKQKRKIFLEAFDEN